MKLHQLTEVRYAYKTPTTEEVYKQYKSTVEKFSRIWGIESRSEEEHMLGQPTDYDHPFDLSASKHKKHQGGSYTLLKILFSPETEEDLALQWTRKFLRKNNLPYSGIYVDTYQIDLELRWSVWIIYNPDSFNPDRLVGTDL